jgi:hypothetical protein
MWWSKAQTALLIIRSDRLIERLKVFVSAIEAPVFGVAVIIVHVIGELNFFRPRVKYQTEPITTIVRISELLAPLWCSSSVRASAIKVASS